MCISFKFPKEHAIIAAEANLSFARSHNNVKDCVYFQWLRLENLAHRIYFDDIHVAKVLTKDEELFLDSIMLIFEKLDIIDSLLQLLVVFFLESVNVKDKEVSIIASDPSQIVVYSTAEKTMAWCLLYYDSA